MLYRQAMEMTATGRNSAALEILGKAVMIAPGFTRALVMRGNCLDRLGRYPEALEAYKKALVIDPSCEEAKIGRDLISKKINASHAGGHFFAKTGQQG